MHDQKCTLTCVVPFFRYLNLGVAPVGLEYEINELGQDHTFTTESVHLRLMLFSCLVEQVLYWHIKHEYQT